MSGNVWEWVADCWHENYEGAPVDGSAWIDDLESNNCASELLPVRGGGWSFEPRDLRSAVRFRGNPGDASYDVGFRLARTL